MQHGKLIVIGAPRSGTNMLRDLVCTLPGCGTWPCDEINFIWRHGNRGHPSDALSAELATAKVQRFIRSRFGAVAQAYGLSTVVEKTCANSLRVPFVDRVVPDAKYLFIVRNGFDAVASAMVRWRAGLDLPYTLRKARFVPWGDVPGYAATFAANRVFRMFSRERRIAQWGPRLEGMSELLSQHALDEVCAMQWRSCVEAAEQALAGIGSKRVLSVRYESVVSDPCAVLRQVVAFLGIPDWSPPSGYEWVSPRRVGVGGSSLVEPVRTRVARIIGPTLARLGYE
jgi:hypothetical protein